MSLAIRIFRWADCPDEYRVTDEREWVAFVPEGRTFDAEAEAGWGRVVTAEIGDGTVVAGDA